MEGLSQRENVIAPRSVSEAFIGTAAELGEPLPPLSPFLLQVWRRIRFGSDLARGRPEVREKFLFWFLETYHRSRFPYHWPLPPATLAWLNEPTPKWEPHSTGQARPGEVRYLTRFMFHIWRKHQYIDLDRGDGFVRFLSWFAFLCLPKWNLPRTLLPQDLIPVLNEPVRSGIPLTAGMLALGRSRDPKRYRNAEQMPDEILLGWSFELLPDVLEAGDPRLVPEQASRFWFSRSGAQPDSLNAYEYLAAKVCCDAGVVKESDPAAIRSWYESEYLAAVPKADVFAPAPVWEAGADTDSAEIEPPARAILVFRDHWTVAGLSTAGASTVEALRMTGLEVADLDFSLGRERFREEFEHNQRAILHAKSRICLLNVNPEFVPECLVSHLACVESADYLIGQFYWELSDITSTHECGLSLVNEIWVASQYLKDVYARRVSAPVVVMGQAVDLSPPGIRFNRHFFGLRDDSYVFLMSFDGGSVAERKNPWGTVEAFQQAFPKGNEKVVLVLKTRNLANLQTRADRSHWARVEEAIRADPRIRIADGTFTRDELRGLYGVSDCYVSLHRSEGFGFGPADAMALGKPVVVTDYSGVVDFCTPETALPVKYTLERAPQGTYPFMDSWREYLWAKPDIRDAARAMRSLYEDPEMGRRLGECGRRLISERYSLEALARRYRARLRDLGWL